MVTELGSERKKRKENLKIDLLQTVVVVPIPCL